MIVEKPYLVHNNKKIFDIYDLLHLLTNVRNNFIKSYYKHDNVEMNWGYNADFFNIEKAMSIRMAPKLIQKHVSLPSFTKMIAHLVAQDSMPFCCCRHKYCVCPGASSRCSQCNSKIHKEIWSIVQCFQQC